MFVLNLFLLALNFALLLYSINFFLLYIFSTGTLSLAHFSKTHDCFQRELKTISATGLGKAQRKLIISTAFLVLGHKITHVVVSVQNVLCRRIGAFTNNINSLILTIHLSYFDQAFCSLWQYFLFNIVYTTVLD